MVVGFCCWWSNQWVSTIQTNLESTRHVNYSFNRLLVNPLSTGPLTDSPGNPCLNPRCLLNSISNSTSHGFLWKKAGTFPTTVCRLLKTITSMEGYLEFTKQFFSARCLISLYPINICLNTTNFSKSSTNSMGGGRSRTILETSHWELAERCNPCKTTGSILNKIDLSDALVGPCSSDSVDWNWAWNQLMNRWMRAPINALQLPSGHWDRTPLA